MATYCLEIRSTQDWQDVRYREYTTSAKKAEKFRSFPKIQFTDSGHGLVAHVRVLNPGDRREKPNAVLASEVRQHLRT